MRYRPDIDGLRAKVQSIAVGWGFNSSARLKQARPHQLINNIEQLEQLLVE